MKNFSIALVAATLLLAGCADDSAPATTQATTTTVPATTATPSTTTGAPETSPTTEAPTTTTSTTGAPQARGPFVAVTDVDLVQIDPSDGSVSNVLFEFFNGEGTFRGVLNLTDNDTVVYQELWEDYWFSCEASRGVIGAIALVDGEPEAIAEGLAPSLSPDGTHLAYLDASDCIPDPEAADSWVLTPLDTVVVTDLVDGTSVTISSSETPQSPSDPAALQWVGWHPDGDLLVADNDGSVYRVPMDSTEPIEAHDAIEIPAGTTLTAASDDRLLGVTPADDGSGYRVETFAIEDGAVSEILVSDDLVAAAFDPNGQVVMARSSMDDPSSPSVLLFENGTEVPLEVRVIDMTW